MHFAKVIGTVVATRKVPELQGIGLKTIIPCDQRGIPTGDPVIAIDAVGSRPGDIVIWVGKREASLAVPGAPLANNFPVDAAVTGLVDDIG